MIVLEDNDVLHVVGGGYGIYNTAQADVETAVPRRLQLLEMEVDSIMKVRVGVGWVGVCVFVYRGMFGCLGGGC